MNKDEFFMKKALLLAKKAYSYGEAPIGCVIVKDGKIISTGYNKREIKENSLLHAEMIAIDRACKKLGAWRLCDTEMYVTLEPCPMCAGAAINSRIKRIVFGAYDAKAGCLGSVTDLMQLPFNHKCEVVSGVMENECSEILSDFFKELRLKKQRK